MHQIARSILVHVLRRLGYAAQRGRPPPTRPLPRYAARASPGSWRSIRAIRLLRSWRVNVHSNGPRDLPVVLAEPRSCSASESKLARSLGVSALHCTIENYSSI
jgi:hypothetical protein